MKPHLFIAVLLVASRLDAINPVNTYTFVDPCTPFVTMSAIQGKHGCYSFTATIGLQVDQGTFDWKFSDGATATGSVAAHCFDPDTVTTVYTGTLSFNSPALCGALPTDRAFTVTVPPAPTGSCIVKSPDVLLSAQSVTVLAGVSVPEIVRSFDYGDGTGFLNTPFHTYTGCGPFVITIKSWDMNFPSDICYGYHAVTISCKDVTTGLTVIPPPATRIYPNPCNDHLFIECKKIANRITVVDVLGKTLAAEADVRNQKVNLQTGQLGHGIFFVKIEYLDNSADVFKIMKD